VILQKYVISQLTLFLIPSKIIPSKSVGDELMKITSKSQYGLKMMCFLASHVGEGAIPLTAIAREISSSEKYCEQILLSLRKADLVKATRGAQGGYYVENPEQISVGAILRTLEEDLVIVDCLSDSNNCPNKCNCQTHVVWDKLYQEINGFLDKMSLTSIIKK